jgi:electron transport complex protein RnfD
MSKLIVSSSPHIKGNNTTQRIMLDVIVALLPAAIMAVVYFGIRALLVILTCVISSVLSEYIARKVMKRDNTIGDLSAAVTGLLLALNLPASLPIWMCVFGSVIAIVVVKQFFGGLGQNFVNPAMTARIILMLCFASAMTMWENTRFMPADAIDGTTSATPLEMLDSGTEGLPSLLHMLIGNRSGSIGECCSLALIIGGIYLLIRRVISPVIPVAFTGTVFVLCMFRGAEFAAYNMLSGGLLLGAIFMATDYVTSPITVKGKWIFGIGCGLITFMIRTFGTIPEGVSFSIILMNILVPHIDNLTMPKPFGEVKEGKQ